MFRLLLEKDLHDTHDIDDDSDIPEANLDLAELSLGKRRYLIGLSLALLSTLFIGSSFIIKKVGLKRLTTRGSLRAGQGGYGYLKEWIWWAGFLCMGFGEIFNFVAYAFAPASLVTPLGALSVLVTAVLARYFLKENINVFGVFGCINCIFGSVIIVLHAPKEGQIKSLDQLGSMLLEGSFIVYLLFVMVFSCLLIGWIVPKYGEKNILVYISICSLIGSLSVMACKGLGLALAETLSGVSNDLKAGLFWFLLFCTITTIMIQMNYLNKALDIFDATLVTPVYYVLFTSLVLLSSSILFQEWKHIEMEDYLGTISGFIIVVTGICLINFFKDAEVNPPDLLKNNSFRRDYTAVGFDPMLPPRSSKQRSNPSTVSHSVSIPKQPRKKRRRNLKASQAIKRQDSMNSTSESSDDIFSQVKIRENP